MHKKMLAIFVVACILAGTASFAQAGPCSATAAGKLCGPRKLTFYLHSTIYDVTLNNTDTFNALPGEAPTIITPPFNFGLRVTFEAPLTKRAAVHSKSLGSAQGFYIFDSLKESLLFHIFNANITHGHYKGSVTIMGQVRQSDPVRYLTVTGGTGAFLGAHGLATNTLTAFSAGPPAHWTNAYTLDLYY